MSEQEPTWAEAMDTLRNAFSRPQVRINNKWVDMDDAEPNRQMDVLIVPRHPGESDEQLTDRTLAEARRLMLKDADAQAIHSAECHRIREAMPTTYETSRNMGYWGNDVLEKHRQCCALQSWYDPRKDGGVFRWFRPVDGWRKP